MSDETINDLAYWFPKIEAAGLPVPETRIVRTDLWLFELLDGRPVPGWEAFIADLEDWRELLAAASILEDEDIEEIATLAGWASGAVGGGYWSIDFLQDRHGKWFLTDMADGDRSWKPT